ncbi:hypothetical protein J416_01479 [Gracilibacillus halophilus YIM-C55.5]|uniref:Uncharacterized protein n=1 Tax=Gracilibacillus halophilus YIM-C55.5 TaxID=1308866 RepID=N4WCX5_9BACI|nr:hypothetical protein [Gracilibacillus halophilus]ENH98128.1 hypothetical protein J416_01479 [Gracilibacillus halophilus YIM-C55.5]
MGLDMGLFAVPKIEGMDLHQMLNIENKLSDLDRTDRQLYQKVKKYMTTYELFGNEYLTIISKVMYWRKANHIHNWFIQHTMNGIDDNPAITEVKEQDIRNLCYDCASVLQDESRATEILPTLPGPFFGSTAYDSFYLYEIERTLDKLSDELSSTFFQKNYVVYQSWW